MEHSADIREAKQQDVDEMKEIWIEFIDFHSDIDPIFKRSRNGHERFGEFVSERIAKPDWHVLVARLDGGIVGHIMGTIQMRPPVFKSLRFGYIQDIAVRQAYRRQGIGGQLLDHLAQWFRRESVHRIELDVVTANSVSNGFWQHVGCHNLMTRYSMEV